MSLIDEIREQPETLGRLLADRWAEVRAIAAELRREEIDQVLVVARGSSDHAGLYAKYLFGIHNRLIVAMAMPSLFTRYHAPPRLDRTLVLGISQSGRSPDLVEALREARCQGAPTVVITNDPTSPLAREARHVIDVAAGPELAVAATKTYSGQLLAVAMLSCAMAEDEERRGALDRVPELVRAGLAHREVIARAAERYRYMDQGVALGRGYNYATVREWSLKLKELCYVVVAPYSSADFRHGPIAVVDRGFPVFAIVSEGPVADDLVELLQALRRDHDAETFAISDREDALAAARTGVRMPPAPEWLTPLANIIPAQLFCEALTRVKGYDTERPRGLAKITSTQ
ncbi:MAG: SIS domain-containing protein [Planctomycetota bacterium]